MEENPNLPDEILIEIFSRLPTKSAGRCRCLSKAWCSQLSTPQFAHLHLSRRRTALEKLLLMSTVDLSLRTIDAPIGDGATSRELDLGVTWNDGGVDWIQVLGTCNGLVLLSKTNKESKEEDLFLVNPTTLHHFKLPHLPLVTDGSSFMDQPRYGLGYDSLHDDYKVVVHSNSCDGGDGRDKLIYSSKSGTWKKVVSDYLVGGFYNGAFLNGAIHWNDGPFEIVAFDLAADVFREIPKVPRKRDYLDFAMVLVIEGCLGIAHSFDDDCGGEGEADIWIMKEYGVGDSWTRFTINTNCEYLIHRPLSPSCVLGDRELVLVTYRGSVSKNRNLVVYDLKEGTTRVMFVDGVPALSSPGAVFVDSLVSPKHQCSI